MALVFDAPVTPGAQTAFVRRVPVPDELKLLTEFPAQYLQTNTVNFSEIVKRNRTARYRTFDGRIHVSSRDAGSSASVSLLPLSTSSNMGEYERLQLEFARAQGTNRAGLANAIYDDSVDLTREVQRRLEQAWGDVLTDGKLTVNENGLVGFEADFGVPSNQKVTAATLWSVTATATVLSDLIAWHDVYVAANGGPAGAIRTSQAVLRLVQTNKQIIDAVHGSTSGKTRVNLAELNDLLAAEGLPPFVAAYDYQVDVDGSFVRTIPANRVLFTPANLADLGYTAWGVSATALELVNSSAVDMSFEEAPGIVGVVIKEGPPFREFTFVDATAMPILSDAKRLMIATVLA
jgi:hypothetical protein